MKGQPSNPGVATSKEAAAAEAPKDTGKNKGLAEDEEPRLKDPFQPIPISVETTIRMTLTAFIAYTLAVIDAPAILPHSQQWLIGLLGTVVIMRIPNMVFTVGGLITVVYALVAFALGSATLILYCVDVGGNGLMIAVATLWALWVSGLRYGILSKLIGIFPSLLVAVIGLIVLNLHRFIRDGVQVSVTQEILVDIEEWIEYIRRDVFDPLFILLIEFALKLLQVPEYLESILKGGIDFPLPEDFGDLAGRIVNVQLDDEETLLVSLEGGSWWLTGFWTWTGTENPLAVMQNFLIICSWSFLAVFCAHLLPPWRTMRYQFARLQLPQALRDAACHMKSPTPVRQTLLNETSFATHGGLPAIMTALEPRFADWRYNWPRCTFLPLFKLSNSVENAMLKALLLDYMSTKTVPNTVLEDYRLNAQALIDRVPKQATKHDDDELPVHEDPLWHKASAKELGDLTDQYLDSMKLNPSTKLDAKEKGKNLLLVVLPFLAPPIALLALLFVEIPLTTFNSLTGRERFDLQKASHHVKFALGFCALFSMSVYWDVFHDFDIAATATGVSGVSVSAGNPIGTFSGWQLVAYAFSTMPTTEGTLKKCVLRVVGTLIGGFSAWAAIRVTGDNKIGFVAWLTITTAGAAYLAVDKGENAERSRMKGTSPDYGYVGFYIALTQAVICMEFLLGLHDGDDLVVNRIVSNLTGILVAAILAIIPPCVHGGDTKWTQLILSESQSAIKGSIEALLEGDIAAVAAIKKRFSRLTDSLRSDAFYLLEDAKRLNSFPMYHVDARLDVALVDAETTCSFLSLTLDRIGELAQKGELELTAENKKELELILAHVQSGIQFAKPDASLALNSTVDVVTNLLQVVQRRLIEHAAALEVIRIGRGVVAAADIVEQEEAEEEVPEPNIPQEKKVDKQGSDDDESNAEEFEMLCLKE